MSQASRVSLPKFENCWSALLALLISAPVLAESTPPVNLGEAGLTLSVRLLAWDGADWPEVATAAALEEIGSGTYRVVGLPTASGTARFHVELFDPADPAIARAAYTYGARPGQRLVWRHEIDHPARPRVLHQGDSFGTLGLKVRRGLPAEIGDPATVVTFSTRLKIDGALLIDSQPATVADVEEDQVSGSWGATLLYDIQPGDLATAGRVVGEFRVCYQADACHTLPSDRSFELRVVPSGGGG